jgi:hypothetical protein
MNAVDYSAPGWPPRDRRLVWASVSVAVVLVAAGITVWQLLPFGSSPAGAPTPCALASSLASQPPASAGAAPGGGGLRMAETGFTQSEGGTGRTVSIGTIVENTSFGAADLDALPRCP